MAESQFIEFTQGQPEVVRGGEFRRAFPNDIRTVVTPYHAYGVPNASSFQRQATLILPYFPNLSLPLTVQADPEGLDLNRDLSRLQYVLTPYDERRYHTIAIEPDQRVAMRAARAKAYIDGKELFDYRNHPQSFSVRLSLEPFIDSHLLEIIDEGHFHEARWDKDARDVLEHLLLELRFNDLSNIKLLSRMNIMNTDAIFYNFFTPDGGEEPKVSIESEKLREGDPLFLPLNLTAREIDFRIIRDPLYREE